MAMLVSMSDVYNSMHLIDLEENTIRAYNARKEVSKVTEHTNVADEAMRQMLTMTTQEEYRDAVLEFGDVTTMADRMQNRKVISREFKSKSIGWYRASIIVVEADETGHPTKVIYVTRDIDEEKKKERELVFKSNTDELTGLYNRRAYEDDISERKDTVTENNFVFVSLDLNGLKKVNDTLGHIAGDELLVGAARCIKQCFGPYGKVYRIGGDEFVAMIFANETQLAGIKKDFEEVTAKWSGDMVKSLSVSCGYVTRQEVDITSVHAIANIADQRMYAAKAKHYGRG
jgi:diguanylate cyclase (GGDEF)-like protein